MAYALERYPTRSKKTHHLGTLFINCCGLRRYRVFGLILALLRGFCLLILKIHTVGILAKESARILYTALSLIMLSNVYK